MQRTVRILRRSVPFWLILFLLIAAGIGAAVGTILAGRVTGEVPVTVGQALLVGEPTFPNGLPGGVNIQSIRINPNRMAQDIGILGDDWTSFQAAVEANTGDVFLIKLPLKNASNQDMIVQLDMEVPDCIEVDVFGSDDESESAVDHVFNVTQVGFSRWVFRLSDLAEHYASDWRDSIGIVVGVDDDCHPGFYSIGVTLQQIAGGASDKAVLGITKTGPATASVNGQVTYSITVTNSSETVTATGLTVKDTIPSGMSYVSSSPVGTLSGNQVTWNLGSLAPRDTTVLSLTLQATQAGHWTNRATASCSEGISVEATAVTDVGTTTQATLTKTGPAQVNQAANAVYTITATNTGGSTLTNAVVTDQIPTGMSYVSSVPAASVVGNTATWSLGTLTAGQQRTLTLTLRGVTTGTWTNSATFSSTQGATVTAQATTVVASTGQISLIKTGPAQVNQAANAVYTITATNTGGSTLTNAVVNDQIPAGMSYVSSVPAATVVGNTATWSLGTLTAGQQRTLTLTLRGDTVGTWTNSATFSSAQGITGTASTTTVVTAAPSGMTMSTTDTTDPVAVGNPTIYVITATNQGGTALHNLRIVNAISPLMTFVSASGPVTYTVSGQTVTFSPVTTVNAHQTLTYYVTVRAVTPGSALNITTMTYDEFPLPLTAQEGTSIFP